MENKKNSNKIKVVEIPQNAKEFVGWFILMYGDKFLSKVENPVIWEIVNEPTQFYPCEKFAKNEIRSLKMYVTRNFDSWEEFEKRNTFKN